MRALLLQQRLDLGDLREREPERDEVARRRAAGADLARQPLQVADVAQRLPNLAPQRRRPVQRLHRVEPLADAAHVAERADEPLAQEAAAHRRARLVEDADERAVAAAVGHAGGQFEVALGRGVEREVVLGAVAADAVDVREAALLRLAEVVQHGARGDGAEVEVVHAEALEAVRLEVAQQRLGREVDAEDPVLLRRERGADGGRQRLRPGPLALVGEELGGRDGAEDVRARARPRSRRRRTRPWWRRRRRRRRGPRRGPRPSARPRRTSRAWA